MINDTSLMVVEFGKLGFLYKLEFYLQLSLNFFIFCRLIERDPCRTKADRC